MILAIVIAAAVYILFAALPALFLLLYLTRRRSPGDFTNDPSRLIGSPYEPWKDLILNDMRRFSGLPFETIVIKSADGLALTGRYYQSGHRTAILLHGYNSTPANNYSSIALALIERGWSVLTPYMRGHAPSEGICTFGLKESSDALLWAEWACGREPSGDIIIYGISMGGASIDYASDARWPDNVKVLISDSGYYCARDQMLALKEINPFVRRLLVPPFALFARALFGFDIGKDSRPALNRAKVPMCFLAGSLDTSVSPDAVRVAYNACGSEKKLLIADGAPHTLAFTAGGEPLQKELFDFIDKYTTPEERL